MSDPVRAALEAAEDAAHIAGCPPGSCAHVAAATIAAFLRALPCCDVMMQRWTNDDPPERDGPHSTITLAAAVEAAAREGA